jgi:hypothetical protein
MYSVTRHHSAEKGMKNALDMLVQFDAEMKGCQGRSVEDVQRQLRQEGRRADVAATRNGGDTMPGLAPGIFIESALSRGKAFDRADPALETSAHDDASSRNLARSACGG